MKNYEGMFIVRPDLNQEELDKIVKTIEKIITSNKGKINDSLNWGKRQLSYKIGRYTEGMYQLLHFQIEPTAIKRLKEGYRLNEDIVRVLITKIEKL